MVSVSVSVRHRSPSGLLAYPGEKNFASETSLVELRVLRFSTPWLDLMHPAAPTGPSPNGPIFGGLGEQKFPVLVGGSTLRVHAPGGP